MEISPEQQAEARAARSLRRAQQQEEREREQHQRDEASERIVRWRDTVAWSSLSQAQKCHADGLSHAFSFLSLGALVAAAQACRSWRTAALQTPPLDLRVVYVNGRVGCKTDEEVSLRLQAIVASPFRKHIGQVDDPTPARYEDFEGLLWSLAELSLLAQLPCVSSLYRLWLGANVKKDEPLPNIIPLPSSLTNATLQPASYDSGPVIWQVVLKSLARCCPAFRKLAVVGEHIERGEYITNKFNLSSIVELQQLEVLILEGMPNVHFSLAVCKYVKQLANLKKFYISCPNEDWMYVMDDLDMTPYVKALLKPPHRLDNLEELPLDGVCIDGDMLQLLGSIHLATLDIPVMELQAMQHLCHLKHLRELRIEELYNDLGSGDDYDEALGERMFGPEEDSYGLCGSFIVSILSPCAATLEILRLHSIRFDDDEAEALCSTLTQLREIHLSYTDFPSLECLHLLKHLRVFNLSLMLYPSFALEMDDVRSLPSSLRHLVLSNLPAKMTKRERAVVAALKSPAEKLQRPELQATFHFREPEEKDANSGDSASSGELQNLEEDEDEDEDEDDDEDEDESDEEDEDEEEDDEEDKEEEKGEEEDTEQK